MKPVECACLAAWLLLGSLAHAQQAPTPNPAPNPIYNPPPPAWLLPPTGLQRTAYQQPRPGEAPAGDQVLQDIQVQLEPPGPERLFGLFYSEEGFKDTLRQEAMSTRGAPEKITFPDEPILTKEEYHGRRWPPLAMVVEPRYVGYSRLLFEQKNFER